MSQQQLNFYNLIEFINLLFPNKIIPIKQETIFNLEELKPNWKYLKDAYYYFGKILHNNDFLMVIGSNATGWNQFSKNIKKERISAI